ncbi:MAG: glycoside hydrolase [Saprospiraceae bacterium]|nr:glycoside hydrolase [Saprospiraceae bacterium]
MSTLLKTFCTGLNLLMVISLISGQSLRNEGVDLSSFSKNYYSIPLIDLDQEVERQVVVDKEEGQYLGHPTTHLLEDAKTLICVYPKGHGRGPIVMKKSTDAGKTWSERLPTPANWASSLEVPTLFPVEDAAGVKRLILFSGLYPTRMAVSEDDGKNWSPLQQVGDWGGIVVMSDVVPLRTGKGHYMALFHDDQRFFTAQGRDQMDKALLQNNQALFTLYKSLSFDGGLSWSDPAPVYSSRMVHLCEPGVVRSPDGRQLAVLLRENSRRMNSFIIFSNDEGKTWTTPRELPNSLTGDRHQAVYIPDGRLFISFRDNSPALSRYRQLKAACKDCDEGQLYEKAGPVSPTAGDWVGWVGTYQDLVEGREGQYRVRLKDNTRGSDCAYPALEILPDGTILATTYGHWESGASPYILHVRFKVSELDARLK